MALQNTITGFQHMLSAAVTPRQTNPRLESFCLSFSSQAFPNSPFLSINRGRRRRSGLRASTTPHKLKSNDGDQDSSDSDSEGENDDAPIMSDEERREWRSKIRQVIDGNPDVEEEMDPVLKRRMMQKLLADYPLVVEEDDPNWPEDADGRGSTWINSLTRLPSRMSRRIRVMMIITIARMKLCGRMIIIFVPSRTSRLQSGKRLYLRISVL
ncbi:Thioredoxin-like fold domain-containing protein MRL7L, chloroplastic [Vitis vinifera]|uniref:Thioredoxin-like fold domain-containing protein MRL7L, chloroplastic n=1 Tax=Vitis vinifera TaxID=29760 RepID=A0A438GA19_VITVI|nr:Thioredoxin-like fold domain-containing protein MRL7L, chloroplastic [Vitis vinifera]